MRVHTTTSCLLTFFLLCFAVTAVAESLNPKLDAKHTFNIGAFSQTGDFHVALTRPPFQKITLDLVDDLNVDENFVTVLVDYRWRFLDRWHLTLGFTSFESDGSRINATEFNFDGEVFQAGYEIETDVNLKAYVFDINYAVSRGDRHEFSVGGGLHAFDLELDLEARLFVNGSVSDSVRETSELLAPLPNIRIYGFYALTPKWHIAATGGWLSFALDEWDGDYLYLNARAEYRVTERFGIGLGYQFVDIDVERDTRDKKAEYVVDIRGPTLYLSYAF